jgi:hypothetical protein
MAAGGLKISMKVLRLCTDSSISASNESASSGPRPSALGLDPRGSEGIRGDPRGSEEGFHG